MCNGQTATIYVQDGKIVGGPQNGKNYKGNLSGTSGNDVLVGTTAKDAIDGGAGDDTICALDGNDKIGGGAGNDTMFGGPGADKFNGGTGTDSAPDFNPAERDTEKNVP